MAIGDGHDNSVAVADSGVKRAAPSSFIYKLDHRSSPCYAELTSRKKPENTCIAYALCMQMQMLLHIFTHCFTLAWVHQLAEAGRHAGYSGGAGCLRGRGASEHL